MGVLEDYMNNGRVPQQSPVMGGAADPLQESIAARDPRIAMLAERLGVDYQTIQDGIYEGRYAEEMKQLESQMGRAEDMQGTAGPRGRYAGRVYTAANPLEHAAAAYSRYRGGQDVDRLTGEQKQMLDQRDKAATAIAAIKDKQNAERQAFLERMFMDRQRQQPAPQLAPQAPVQPQAPQPGPPPMVPPQGPPPPQPGPGMNPAMAFAQNRGIPGVPGREIY